MCVCVWSWCKVFFVKICFNNTISYEAVANLEFENVVVVYYIHKITIALISHFRQYRTTS